MNWSNTSLDEILENLPRRFRSYSEYKAKRMQQAESNTVEDVYPKTVREMEQLINESIDYARSELTDLEMFGILNNFYDNWIKIKNSFIVMSVIIASLKHRDKEGIERFLKQISGKDKVVGR